jgi:hypothetical protein
MKTVLARGVKGKKGDIILELPGGKVGLPRGFTPREWEWYDVEIIEDRGNYAFVRLHHHRPTSYGICKICGAVVHRQQFEAFAAQWLNNMLLKRSKEIEETAALVIKRLDVLIDDLEDMIKRLYKMSEQKKHVVVKICEHAIDSCFSETCADDECVRLGQIIWSLERIRNELNKKRWAIARTLAADKLITITPDGIRRIFVCGY